MNYKLFITLIILSAFFVFLPAEGAFASSLGSLSGYAWGANLGWINFGCSKCGGQITDVRLTGYAWSDNYGWINLNPTNGGVKNNGEGTLSGKAFGEQLGWIDFNGVTISSSGSFSGTASADNGGSISFSCANCNVSTGWRYFSSRSPGGPAPTLAPAPTPSAVLSSQFKLTVNNGNRYANNQTVNLILEGGADTEFMAISNTADFSNAIIENYQKLKVWTLIYGDGPKTVYVKFYNKDKTAFNAVSAGIALDTLPPEIIITAIKDAYGSNEDVIISGVTELNANVVFILGSLAGSFKVDGEGGKWTITLGKIVAAEHTITFTATDLAGNVGKSAAINFSVVAEIALEPKSVGEKIEEGAKKLFYKILKPGGRGPKTVLTVPKTAPLSLEGKWRIFPVDPIERFVLAFLPEEIKVLAQKFPQLGQTLTKLGIIKITDVEKLRTAQLKLPALSEVLGSAPIEISPGKFAPPAGILIANLPSVIKETIPSGIVFVKTAGGLLDVNIALSVNNQGKVNQNIETIAGQPLQLVVKTETDVKSVRGYIVFKSKKPQRKSAQIPLRTLSASLLFSNPDFRDAPKAIKQVALEGVNIPIRIIELPTLDENIEPDNIIEVKDGKGANIEERLVLQGFNYVDSGDGVYVAYINTPVVDGEYEIITTVEYENKKEGSKEIKLTTVVDPEGYIYEKNGDKETRIVGAVVSLYWLSPETKQYQLWPARDFQQENPQTTDVRGTYSFLVPNGFYYLKVDAPGYQSYDGKAFEVKEGSGVHINIELNGPYWWLKFFDWKTILLILAIYLLTYNFYKDRMREKSILKSI